MNGSSLLDKPLLRIPGVRVQDTPSPRVSVCPLLPLNVPSQHSQSYSLSKMTQRGTSLITVNLSFNSLSAKKSRFSHQKCCQPPSASVTAAAAAAAAPQIWVKEMGNKRGLRGQCGNWDCLGSGPWPEPAEAQEGKGPAPSLWGWAPWLQELGSARTEFLHSLSLPYPICGQIPVCDFPSVFPLLLVEVGFAFLPRALLLWQPPKAAVRAGSRLLDTLRSCAGLLARKRCWNSCPASFSPLLEVLEVTF